jgi:cholinesterase
MLAHTGVESSTASPAELRCCSQLASLAASGSFTCAVNGASSGRGEDGGQGRAARARNRGTGDEFAGRLKAKRVELAPRARLPAVAETLDDGRLPDGEAVANLESGIREVYEVGGRRFRVALLPIQNPGSRGPGLRFDPQLRRIPAEMRAELTGNELAMS